MIEQPPVAVRPDHQIDVRRPRADVRLQVLGHAARDPEDDPRSRLVLGEHAGPLKHPLLRLLTNCAGVDQDQIGARGVVGPYVPLPVKQTEHHVTVRDIHLAAVRLDVRQQPGGDRCS